MSNPGSPAPVGVGADKKEDGNGNGAAARENHPVVAKHLDPVVRLESLEIDELQGVKKKTTVMVKGGNKLGVVPVPVPFTSPSGSGNTVDSETDSATSPASIYMDTEQELAPPPPPPPKQRRPSVHFAEPAVTSVVEAESRSKSTPTVATDKIKQESSRKHRSRKEKLVCRSESPSDMRLDSSENRNLPSVLSALVQGGGVSTKGSCSGGALTSPKPNLLIPSEVLAHQSDVTSTSTVKTVPTPTPSPSVSSRTAMMPPNARPIKIKPPLKRSSSRTSRATGGSSHAHVQSGSSRRYSPVFASSSGSVKEPIKKKRVIEIVSPRKRKMDHFHLMKTSSDPIFIRAANKPFKLKNKSHHNRLKFSRTNLNKSSSHQHQSGSHRIRRESLQLNSMGHVTNKQWQTAPDLYKEPESEPTFPSVLVDDLMWILQEAEKELTPDRSSKSGAGSSTSAAEHPSSSSAVQNNISDSSATIPTAAAKGLAFGRRRVESEPPSVGFDVGPHSPPGPQSFYHLRKEIYFSPSPSYAAAGPTRRRYSRRRHSKIHPPFDNTNCNFQGHHCPNAKITGSQYREKHLDKGPTSGYSHCRHMKDGRQCGNLFSTFDPSMTFCEEHAYLVAQAEYEKHSPNVQPDPAKNIISKMGKILSDGLSKTDFESMDASRPVILQIAEDADVVQELPLGIYNGGQLDECDSDGERSTNPDKPDYDALKNAGYFTTEEIIQMHINKLRKLKGLYQREKELEWLTRQHKFRYFKEGLEKLKHCGPKFTTNPYLIDKLNADLPKDYIDHQIRQYEAAKSILQTAYRADGQRGLLRLKMLKKAQDLERMAKATCQKQHHDAADIYDSESDNDSDSGESRDRRESSRYTTVKPLKCDYNEGYAISACPNPPVYRSHFCFKHILSDHKQVQWVACGRSIGPHPQDICKTPVLRVIEKHGCSIHAPLVLTKHKPLKRSEEELQLLGESDHEEEEVSLEDETVMLENLVSDECIRVGHLDDLISRIKVKGPSELTDTSDTEETDEDGPIPALGTFAMDSEEMEMDTSM